MRIAYSIIHVDKDTDRAKLVEKNKQYLSEYFDELETEYYGIYNKQDLSEYLEKGLGLQIDPTCDFRYSEIGAWASHYSVWQKFYYSDYDAILILEDDIAILNDFYRDLLEKIAMLPDEWNAFFPLVPENNFSLYTDRHYIGVDPLSELYMTNWLGAYLLNKEGVKKILDSLVYPVKSAVDNYLLQTRGLMHSYSLIPKTQIFLEGVNFGTTIHSGKRVSDAIEVEKINDSLNSKKVATPSHTNIVYTGGTFDLFHSGHVNLLKKCKELAGTNGKVVVSLNTGDFIKEYKGKAPICSDIERKTVLEACRYVDEVVMNVGGPDSKVAIDLVKPTHIVVGSDWAVRDYHKQMDFTQDWLDQREIILCYVPYTKEISSTQIKERL